MGLCVDSMWGHQTKTHIRLRKDTPVRRGKRREGAFVIAEGSGEVVKRWAKMHDCCIDCGTIERPHRAGGRCKRCDDRWRYRSSNL